MAARKTSAARRVPSQASSARAVGVVLERIESQMHLVLEAVTSSRQHLDAKIDAVEARLSERISVLEQVVRKNSEDIRALQGDVRTLQGDVRTLQSDVRTLQGDVQELKVEVARLRHDFDHRDERFRMDALEARVKALEARVGGG